MASETDHPDFDWLKKQDRPVHDVPDDENVFDAQHGLDHSDGNFFNEESPNNLNADVDEPSSIHDLPAPENNESDGTTLIMKEMDPQSDLNAIGMEEFSPADRAAAYGQEHEEFNTLAESFEEETEDSTGESAATEPTLTPARELRQNSEQSSVNYLLIFLMSYASIMTLVALFLALGQHRENPLESLPDVAPEPADSLSYVPESEQLPTGHTLRLGESRRFGNILVEPLAVSQEPIQFVHYSGDPRKTRAASQPVYKLKLRFTNVSTDQKIAPFDRQLTLRRIVNSQHEREFSNYYILADQSKQDGLPIGMYPLILTSDWDMDGQHLGRVLEPSESFETYLASEEGLAGSPGTFTWRFQFRKGFSTSGHGVTTVAEVVFTAEDVQMTHTTDTTQQPSV